MNRNTKDEEEEEEEQSLLVLTAEICKKERDTMRLLGLLCMPCFCVGFACLFPSIMIGEISGRYAKLVEFYGGKERARLVAKAVRREKSLFREAVASVEDSSAAPELDLLDLVKHNNAHFNAMLCGTTDIWNVNDSDKPYRDAVWNEYRRLGGNGQVVIHGFLEYLLHTMAPTSEPACRHVEMLLHDADLRAEVQAAGRNAEL